MADLPTTESEDEIEGLIFGGRYKAASKLGEGGLGTVYKGIQLNLEQDVAIKILKTEFSSDEVLVSRFCNEARIYAKINNPHVVKIHEFGQDDSGHLYLVMEFLPGRDLMDLIRERGPLDTAFMVNVATQVVQGLQAAHALGIVHRDIKPDNIMIQNAESERPFSRLLDFGISKMGEEEEQSASKVSSELGVEYKKNLTAPGEVTGTPLFMAPEQCRAKVLDARTDIYSMGLVLYNMAYGVPPFQCEDLHDLLRMQVFDDPPKEQRERVEGVPPELEEIILRCLRKDPEERYQSATELLSDLEEVYKVVSGPAMMKLLNPATNSGLGELEGAETDTEKAKASAAEICKGMGKAHRSFILYPTDNPIISQVTDELFRNLTDFTERYGDLVLNCAHFSMYLLTERVYDNPDLRTSFPFKLYTDGVRRLFFHEGLSEDELKSFIECLRKVTQGEEPNSDLVTLMWSKNFRNISYLTVEELTLESLPDADVLNNSDTVVAGADKGTDPRGRRKAARSTVGERAPAFHVPLSEEEQRHLQSLIDVQINLDSVASMARALLTVLSRTHDAREVSQLVKVLTRIGHALIARIDLEHLLPILKATRKLLSRLSEQECSDDLQSLLDRASAPETVEDMIGWMKASESPAAPKTLSSYLSVLNASAVPVIISAIPDLEEKAELPAVQLALMKLCVHEVKLLTPGVESDNTKTMVSTLRVLSEIGKAEGADLVIPLFDHAEPDVRYAAVCAMVKIRIPGFEGHFHRLVSDKELRIRTLVLQVFLKIPNLEDKDFLIKRLETPGFKEMDMAEHTLFFKVLARHESREIHAALLRQLQSEKKWFQMRSNQLLMAATCAAVALFPATVTFLGWSFGLVVWGALLISGGFFVKGEFEKLQAKAGDLIEPSARCLVQMKSPEAAKVLGHVAQEGQGRAQKICKRVTMKR